ncbi:MAG: hypothetical protein KF703_16375, partial [Actinobacteria bacterium]|nr:hypothetical protein [Actinomycetota bacterium]
MRDASRTSARTSIAAGLVALALLAAGCSSDDGDAADDGPTTTAKGASTTTAVVDEDPTFVSADCWWELPDDVPVGTTVTCGTVDVP